MIAPLLYLTRRTFVNGLRRRLSRIREPRYATALAMGLLYAYWILARPGATRPDARALGAVAEAGSIELLLAWLLLAFVASSWLIGKARSPLPFTPAETQFLFTAPLTRRQVITFKLLRLQVPLLISAIISVLLFSRGHLTPMRGAQAVGVWLLLTIVSLHSAAATFVRANLADHGLTGVRRQMAVLTAVAAIAVVCLWSLRAALPDLAHAAALGIPEFLTTIGRVSDQGGLAVVLTPFRLAVAPVAAHTPWAFAAALPGALALLAVHYVWVVRSAIHFEDVAIEDADRRALRIAAARHGRFALRTAKGHLRPPLYRLRPTGSPAEAFLWKSLLAVTRQVGRRVFVILAVGTAAVAILAAQGGERGASAGFAAGAVLIAMAGIAVVLGPRALRQDLREDLLLLDVLRSYPVRGRDIVLGEVLGPTVALTLFAWVTAAVGFALLAPVVAMRGALSGWTIALAAAFVVIPGIVLVQVTAQNGFAVFFPAWTALGAQMNPGIERLGQQILVMLGSLLLLTLVLIPAGMAAAIVWFLIQTLSVPVAAIAAAALGSAVLVFEAYLGTLLIGARLEQTDPAEIPGAE